MDNNSTALTFDELNTARVIIRLFRFLTVLGTAVALPVVIVLLTPIVGWALIAAIVFSPLLLTYVFLAAARQARQDRQAGA